MRDPIHHREHSGRFDFIAFVLQPTRELCEQFFARQIMHRHPTGLKSAGAGNCPISPMNGTGLIHQTDRINLRPAGYSGRVEMQRQRLTFDCATEIDFDKIDENWGMDIVIATTAKTDAEGEALLKEFNMPFTS